MEMFDIICTLVSEENILEQKILEDRGEKKRSYLHQRILIS